MSNPFRMSDPDNRYTLLALRADALKTATERATRVATARADAHENPRSAIRRMGALWTAWARIA